MKMLIPENPLPVASTAVGRIIFVAYRQLDYAWEGVSRAIVERFSDQQRAGAMVFVGHSEAPQERRWQMHREIARVLEEPKRPMAVAVVGGFGMGKSSMLNAIGATLAEPLCFADFGFEHCRARLDLGVPQFCTDIGTRSGNFTIGRWAFVARRDSAMDRRDGEGRRQASLWTTTAARLQRPASADLPFEQDRCVPEWWNSLHRAAWTADGSAELDTTVTFIDDGQLRDREQVTEPAEARDLRWSVGEHRRALHRLLWESGSEQQIAHPPAGANTMRTTARDCDGRGPASARRRARKPGRLPRATAARVVPIRRTGVRSAGEPIAVCGFRYAVADRIPAIGGRLEQRGASLPTRSAHCSAARPSGPLPHGELALSSGFARTAARLNNT